MKKKLEADLISLAHKILQLKNKQNVVVLQQEALKLYEKLSVLRFVEEHFDSGGPTIGREAVEEKLESYESVKTQSSTAAEVSKSDESEEKNQKTVPAPSEIASVIEQLAASKSVADDDLDDIEEPAENLSEETESETDEEYQEDQSEELSEEESSENQSEAHETSDDGVNEKSDEKEKQEESEQPEETQDEVQVDSPTFQAAIELEQPEAAIEVQNVAEENLVEGSSDENESADEPVASLDFTPSFQLDFDAKEAAENKYDQPAPSFTFDDLLGKDYADPIFVTRDELDKEASDKAQFEEKAEPRFPESTSAEPVNQTQKSNETRPEIEDIWSRRPFETTQSEAESNSVKPEFEKPIPSSTLNEKLSKGITIGLNDRIAFMKNLFNNSSEDYNRVLSQLMTIDNYAEARHFVQNMVKPDYNNWQGKEEFEERFMEIVEKRFL